MFEKLKSKFRSNSAENIDETTLRTSFEEEISSNEKYNELMVGLDKEKIFEKFKKIRRKESDVKKALMLAIKKIADKEDLKRGREEINWILSDEEASPRIKKKSDDPEKRKDGESGSKGATSDLKTESDVEKIDYIDYFVEKFEKDIQFREAFYRLKIVFILLKLESRDEHTGLISRHLGIDTNFLLKYMLAIFGNFNKKIKNINDLKPYLKEEKGRKDMQKELSYILIDDVFQAEKDGKEMVIDKCNRFTKLIKEFDGLYDLPDSLIKAVSDIDAQEDGANEKLKEDSHLETIRSNARLKYPLYLQKILYQDEAKLDQIIEQLNMPSEEGGVEPSVNNENLPPANNNVDKNSHQETRQPNQPNQSAQQVIVLVRKNINNQSGGREQPQYNPGQVIDVTTVDPEELRRNATKLAGLLNKFKTLNPRECEDLKNKMNLIEISRGYNLGDAFYATDLDDTVQVIIDLYEPANQKELEALIIKISSQLSEKNII